MVFPKNLSLGHFLFLLHINDIMNVLNLATQMLFDDDTNIFLCGNNLSISMLISTVKIVLDQFLSGLNFKANKLSLNVKI